MSPIMSWFDSGLKIASDEDGSAIITNDDVSENKDVYGKCVCSIVYYIRRVPKTLFVNLF